MTKLSSYISIKENDYSQLNNISTVLNISNLTARLLINRGMNTIEECKQFLEPSLVNFYDPYLLKDMDKAVNRIIKAIKNNEKIYIYGDYDVDGVTSTSILSIFLKQIKVNSEFYIPNRFNEGYGLNKDAVDKIINNGGGLIITVDCGITSIDVVNYCNEKGIDIIITDHHYPQEKLPDAIAVINPNRQDDNYPYKKLAGVGVALKLIQALAKTLNIDVDYNEILPIAAIGTVADVVELKDENRIIVKNGLNIIKNTCNLGIKALLEVTGLTDKIITSGHIGFVIGPRINAAGRLESAEIGVELFLSSTYDKALKLASLLDSENKKRQEIEREILEKASVIIKNDLDYTNEKVLVVSAENWHHGVIGIVSSRITEKFYKPSVLISVENNEGRGSARSISNFDIFDSLNKCKDLFIKFGGHPQAAGLSLEYKNINNFRKKINEIADNVLTDEDMIPEIKVESLLHCGDISEKNIEEIKLLEPFGIGNPSPVFIIRDAKLLMKRLIGKDKNHIKLVINKSDVEYDCIGFNLGYLFPDLNVGEKIDIITTLDINEYLGNRKIQLNIKEIKNVYNRLYNLKNNYFESLYNKLIHNSLFYNDKINNSEVNNKRYSKNNITRDNYVINKLYNDEGILIIVDNFESIEELFNIIDIKGRELQKRFHIDYNVDKNINKNCILVNPILEEINFNNYKEVIFYDSFIKYSFINNQSLNVSSFIECDDRIDYKNNLENIIPTLYELRIIYKRIKEENKKMLDLSFFTIKNNFNNTINIWKYKLSLFILKEAKLLNYEEIETNKFLIDIIPIKQKIDITNVDFYKKLIEII